MSRCWVDVDVDVFTCLFIEKKSLLSRMNNLIIMMTSKKLLNHQKESDDFFFQIIFFKGRRKIRIRDQILAKSDGMTWAPKCTTLTQTPLAGRPILYI